MNRLQEAIAQLTGVNEVVEQVKQEATEQVEGLRQGQLEAADIMEHLVSDNSLLQRQIEDLDYLNLFEMPGVQDIIPLGDRKAALLRLRRLRHDNPLAKQAVKLVVRFTLGKGVQYTLARDPEEIADEEPGEFAGDEPVEPTGSRTPPPSKIIQLPRAARAPEAVVEDEKDPIQTIIDGFYSDPDNRLAFTTHRGLQQFLDDILTDGEKFYACFEGDADPYIKISEIPIDEMTDVIYDPDNRLKPVLYRRSYVKQKYTKDDRYEPAGKPIVKFYRDYRINDEEWAELKKNIQIPDSKIDKDIKIRHVLINEIWTKRGKRGLSELYSSREWFKVFREFMEGRASINNAAQAISYVRKIKGGPTAVASFGGKFGGLPVGDQENPYGIRPLTKPTAGAIYDQNEAVDLSWMKSDTGAVNAKEDARMLLMSAGAGVGTMVHYFGEGGDANLATAQSMELPMVKSYEDWQQFIQDFMNDWLEYLFMVAFDRDEEKVKETMARVGWIFPPIISQDVVKYTTAWSQIVRDIAPNNPPVKRQAIRAVLSIMGVPNINALMPEIERAIEDAEIKREEMNEAMMNQPPPVFGANGKTTIPNEGGSPNLKALASGKVKAANGPKPE